MRHIMNDKKEDPFNNNATLAIVQEKLKQYPFPIAVAFQKILSQKKIEDRLKEVFETYHTIVIYISLLLIAYSQNQEENIAFFQEILKKKKTKTKDWLNFLKIVLLRAHSTPFLSDTLAWYNEVNEENLVYMSDLVAKTDIDIGLLTVLADLQDNLKDVLFMMIEEEIKLFWDFSFACLIKIIYELQYLFQYPLCFIESIQDNMASVLDLQGFQRNFEKATWEFVIQPPVKKVCIYDTKTKQFHDMSPLIIYDECYYCLQINLNLGMEVLLYEGRTSNQILYRGSYHSLAVRKVMNQFLAWEEKFIEQKPKEVFFTIHDLYKFTEQRLENTQNYLSQINFTEYYHPRFNLECTLDKFIQSNNSLFVLVGDTGVGKTTSLAHMANTWRKNGHIVFFMPMLAGKVENIVEELDRFLEGSITWENALKIMGIANVSPIIIIDGIEKIDSNIKLLYSILQFTSQHTKKVRVIISTHLLYYHIHKKIFQQASPLSFLCDSKIPWMIESTPYYELTNFSEKETKVLFKQMEKYFHLPATPWRKLSEYTRYLLGNPAIMYFFLSSYQGQDVPKNIEIQDIFENYLAKYIYPFPKQQAILEELTETLLKQYTSFLDLNYILKDVPENLQQSLVLSDLFSPLHHIIKHGILGNADYLCNENMLYFGKMHLMQHLIYRYVALRTQQSQTTITSYLEQLYKGHFLLHGVVHYDILLLLQKCFYDKIASLFQNISQFPEVIRFYVCYILQIRFLKHHQLSIEEKIAPMADVFLQNILSEPILYGIMDFVLFLYQRDEKKAYQVAYFLLDKISSLINESLKEHEAISFQILFATVARQAELNQDIEKISKRLYKKGKHLDTHPQRLSLYCIIAKNLYYQNDMETAKFWYYKCIDSLQTMTPEEFPEAQQIFVYGEMGHIAYFFENYKEAIHFLSKKHTLLENKGEKTQLAEVLLSLGICYQRLDQVDKALFNFQKSIDLSQEISDNNTLCVAQYFLGILLAKRGDLDEAKKSLLIAEPYLSQKPEMLARLHVELGRIYQKQDIYDKCRTSWYKALDYFKKQKSSLGDIALCYENIGLLEFKNKKLQVAIDNYLQAYYCYEQTKDNMRNLANIALNLAQAYQEKGDYQQSVEYCHKCLQFKVKMNTVNSVSTGELYCIFALNCAQEENFIDAINYIDQAEKIYKELDDVIGISHTIYNRALIYELKGEVTSAMQYFNEAIIMLEQINDFVRLGKVLNKLGMIYIERSDLYKALPLFERALQIYQTLDNLKGIATCYNNIAMIHNARGEYEQALQDYQKNFEIAKKLGDSQMLGIAYCHLAETHCHLKQYSRALLYYEKALVLFQQVNNEKMYTTVQKIIEDLKCKI